MPFTARPRSSAVVFPRGNFPEVDRAAKGFGYSPPQQPNVVNRFTAVKSKLIDKGISPKSAD
jgi:hypothetical protein